MTKKPVVPPRAEGRPGPSLPGLALPRSNAAGFDPATLKAGPFARLKPGGAKGKPIPLPGKTRGR